MSDSESTIDDTTDSDFESVNTDEWVSDESTESDSSLDGTSGSDSDDNMPLALLSEGKWVARDIARSNEDEFEDGSDDEFQLHEGVENTSSAYKLFKFVFPNEMMEHIVDQSNRYRNQQNMKCMLMTVEEIHRLIGVLFYMACVQIPRKEGYWHHRTRQRFVADCFTLKRFKELLRMLHFNDLALMPKKCDPAFDRYYKIRPMIDKANIAFDAAIATPEKRQSIDEMMIKFKGRAPQGLKQYLPLKPTKRGYKVWTRSGVSGYVYQIEPYQPAPAAKLLTEAPLHATRAKSKDFVIMGAEKLAEEMFLDVSQVNAAGASGQVVLRLVKDLPKLCKVYFDNYFASYPLLCCLSKVGLQAVCTLRQNRSGKLSQQCPVKSEKELAKEGRGSYDVWTHEGDEICVVAWFDNRRVLLGSNYCGVEPVSSAKRFDRKANSNILIPRPHIVEEYNAFMGGVDKSNMLCSLYPIDFRSKKWYTRIFFRILDLAASNAWLLFKKMHPDVAFGLYNFKLELAVDLIKANIAGTVQQLAHQVAGSSQAVQIADGPPLKKVRESRDKISREARYDGHMHLPDISVSKNGTRCKLCPLTTFLRCTKCDVHLCLVTGKKPRNCFALWHKKSG